MKPEYTIYISSPKNICNSEWMSTFVKKLQMALTRTCPVDLSYVIKDKEDHNWIKSVEQANFFITILDANNDDEKFLTELRAIGDKVHAKTESHLFKICLAPGNSIHQPDIFQGIRGYNFYEYFGRKETITSLDFLNKDQSIKSWNLMLDLAFDLKQIIDNTPAQPTIQDANNKFIYLAHCSADLLDTYNELKRELQHFGFNILPKTDINYNPDNLDFLVLDSLERCSYVVQIIGRKYGNILSGEKKSLLEKEHNAITKVLSERDDLKRLIWIPENLKRKEHKQEVFISRMKQKDSNLSTEIIESSLDEFKDILGQRLVIGKEKMQKETNPCMVYLIAPPNSDYTELTSLANNLNLNINTIDNSSDKTHYNQHLKFLAESNNVLIFWTNKDQFWLKSKLSDLVKAPGWGRKKPFDSIGILANGTTPDLSNFASWLPDIKIIPYNNSAEIQDHLQHLIE